MTIRQILTDWITASGTGKVSVMYFSVAEDVDVQRTRLGTFWSAVDGTLDNTCGWTIQSDGVELDETDGTLTGSWTDLTLHNGIGAGNDECVPDASMVLTRWKTGIVADGRFLQGRTYIPGLGAANTTSGNLGEVSRGIIQDAADVLVAATAGLGVWHRPVFDPETHALDRPGSFAEASSANVWREMAVLRRRRG